MQPQNSPDRHKRSASASSPDRVPSIFSGQRRPPSVFDSSSLTSQQDPLNIARDRQGLPRKRSTSFAVQSPSSEGPLSPDTQDRVFPIKSYVSVNNTPLPTQSSLGRSDSYFPGPESLARSRAPSSHQIPTEDRTHKRASVASESSDNDRKSDVGSESQTERKTSNAFLKSHNVRDTGQGYEMPGADTASVKSESIASVTAPSDLGHDRADASSLRSAKLNDDSGPALLTARFKHVVTEGGHAVITGRDGDTLQRCEDEPIHIPGAVQSFGALVALREEPENRLVVRVVSENSRRVLGYSPRQLFALDSFTDLLSVEQAENLMDHVDFIKEDETAVDVSGPEVFTLSIRNQQRRPQKLWCAIHVNPNQPEMIICEFELEDDPAYPLAPANDHTPEPPEDTLSSEPTEDELRESTETKSRPLRVLRSARKRKGEAAAMEVFNVMSQVQEQLAEAPNLDEFLKVLVGVVKELSGFHRVMIYQFDSSWNGSVVTELVDPRATKDLYKGLHFPASDIPKQARDLYRINKVRLLYDRDHETARLVCRTVEDLEKPLDLTHSYLRAMSPIHIKYLANMAVRSSMSISINAFNELWGLISCHTYGTKGTRVSFPIRKMCRLVGDSASRNIERLSYASRLQARKLINTAPTRKNPSGYIIASSDDLLSLFGAEFGLLSIHDETKILGKLEATQEALAIMEYLRVRRFTSVMSSQDVQADFPDLRYPPGFQTIAGLLLVPLTTGGGDFMAFFRKGQTREVKWAGNPYEKYIKEGTEGYLEPRKSFKTWSETVVGRCREWTEEESETAGVLCLVYGKFIEVWRQKEAALQNTQLTRLLLANSAHEVRTPLNAIINYLEIAMEGNLDSETRDNLSRSHSASRSLIYVINDLLDLTKTESSAQLVREEAFDLKGTYHEAVGVFEGDAKRKGIGFEVIEEPGLPDLVLGDERRVRQAISNIIANAIEATSEGGVTTKVEVAEMRDTSVNVEIVAEDTGVGMNSQQLDALFAELEQAQTETDNVIKEAIAPGSSPVSEEKEEKKPLGLGLAVVARTLRNMDGQLRVKSEPNRGSRFTMSFQFDLPASECKRPKRLEAAPTPKAASKDSAHDALEGQKEVTLVQATADRQVSNEPSVSKRPSLSRQNSAESGKSLTSLKSHGSVGSMASGKSDVDRLIEAMQEPHMVEGHSSDQKASRPASSKSGHAVFDDRNRQWRGEADAVRKHRSHSYESVLTSNEPKHLRSMPQERTGQRSISGMKQPLRPIRMPEDDLSSAPAVESSIPSAPAATADIRQEPVESMERLDADHMGVLVAEDDPINSKIIQKRMQTLGHQVFLTVNGEECASTYGEKPQVFDVILMDMQVSIPEKTDAPFTVIRC